MRRRDVLQKEVASQRGVVPVGSGVARGMLVAVPPGVFPGMPPGVARGMHPRMAPGVHPGRVHPGAP